MEAFDKHLAEKDNIIKDLSRKVNSADEKINILSKKLRNLIQIGHLAKFFLRGRLRLSRVSWSSKAGPILVILRLT